MAEEKAKATNKATKAKGVRKGILPPNFETALAPNKFKKGGPGGPGRRPKFLTLIKNDGYKHQEVIDSIKALLTYHLSELETVLASPQATIMELTIAKALIKAYNNGSLYALETLLSRAYGLPKESLEAIHQIDGPIQIILRPGGPPISSREEDVDV